MIGWRKRIEVFTAGCPLCDETCRLVRSVACPDCEVVVYDLRREGLDAAQRYGVTSVPTVVVDGRIIGSTVGGKVTEAELKAAGVSALS